MTKQITFEFKDEFFLPVTERTVDVPFSDLEDHELTGDQDQILDYPAPKSEEIVGLLTPSQQIIAEEAIRAMVDVLHINENHSRLIIGATGDGEKNISLVDTSPNGQHIGNFESIARNRQSNPDWYFLEFNDQRVDVLESMTYWTYWSMICEANSRGIVLQDSVALSHENDELWTATMLTGEALTDEGQILIASVSSNAVSNVGFRTNRGGRSIRVRPTVVIATQ